MLDYFDAFLIGLTATPDKRTFGFFHENVVSEYSHEDAVADGVNVGHDVYRIDTKVTREGALIAKQQVEQRDRLTRKKRWQQPDEFREIVGTVAKGLESVVRMKPARIRETPEHGFL